MTSREHALSLLGILWVELREHVVRDEMGVDGAVQWLQNGVSNNLAPINLHLCDCKGLLPKIFGEPMTEEMLCAVWGELLDIGNRQDWLAEMWSEWDLNDVPIPPDLDFDSMVRPQKLLQIELLAQEIIVSWDVAMVALDFPHLSTITVVITDEEVLIEEGGDIESEIDPDEWDLHAEMILGL